MTEAVKPKSFFRRSFPFWLMLAIFAAPFIAATFLYESGTTFSLGKAGNKGDLISPVRKIEPVQMEKLLGGSINSEELLGKWTLVTVGSKACGDKCLENMYKMRQVRLATGRERSRVNRLYIMTDEDREQFSTLLEDFDGMIVVFGKPEIIEAFKFKPTPRQQGIEGGIYIVDPMGNYMMAYKPGFEAEGILKDLQRLLKLSRIG
jgi:cytochrome oxidase Cu insertion factor (SCO1/SenC/PrrC family)